MPGCDACPNCPAQPLAEPDLPPADVRAGARRGGALSGILNVDKPAGMTSHDVVDAVRRMAGQRRVGHAGTLDPLATGVLLICLGAATRVAEYLASGSKRYRATIVLGATTDTYDAEGRVLAAGGRTDFSLSEIEAALSSFVGRIQQIPPMYSAVKQQGQPLYRLARRGETVERSARTVDIAHIAVLDWTPPALIVEIACSPGTYVRSLAHDLGHSLGCGGYLSTLVRLSSGRFTLEDAVSLDRLAEAFRLGREDDYLLPLDEALIDLPALIATAADAQRILHGQDVQGDTCAGAPPVAPDGAVQSTAPVRCRAYSLDGDFLAVLSFDPATGRWRPDKVFAPPPGQDA